MNIIKVNYNNAYIKKEKYIEPTLYYGYTYVNGRKAVVIYINNNLKDDSLYTDFNLEFYANDVLVGYANANSGNTLTITNQIVTNAVEVTIKVEGYYFNTQGNKQDIKPIYLKLSLFPKCGSGVLCSQRVLVNSLVEGYLYENHFYETKISDTEFENEITDMSIGLFYDKTTKLIYKWNSDISEFVII